MSSEDRHLQRKVSWRIVYTGDNDELGFLTTCSAVVNVVLGQLSVTEVVLDQASREARHDAYKKWRATEGRT